MSNAAVQKDQFMNLFEILRAKVPLIQSNSTIYAESKVDETIILKVIGGMMSQFGLYAIGKIISLRTNCKIKLDLSFFENTWVNTTKRSFRLYNILKDIEIASSRDIGQILQKDFDKGPWKDRYLYLERAILHLHHGSDSNLLYCTPPKYIIGDGWFPGAFAAYSHELQNCIFIKPPVLKTSIPLLQAAGSMPNSVSLHIRMGDYIPENREDAVKWLKRSWTFYQKAVGYVEEETLNDATYFVFSDNIKYVKEHIDFIFSFDDNERIMICEYESEDLDYEVLRLMLQCKYHVSIGSCFSLWAAFLSKRTDKVLIVPNELDRNKYDGCASKVKKF